MDKEEKKEKKEKIPRQKMPEQDPRARVRNFDEVPLGYSAETALLEAKRCIMCKKPGCVAGCPVAGSTPSYNPRRIIRMAILAGFTATLLLGGRAVLRGDLEVGIYSVLVYMTQRLLWPLTRLGESRLCSRRLTRQRNRGNLGTSREQIVERKAFRKGKHIHDIPTGGDLAR